MNKRRLKKAILAEALRVCRDESFGVAEFLLDLRTGECVTTQLSHPHEWVQELTLLCNALRKLETP
jgi:hypothetical protein